MKNGYRYSLGFMNYCSHDPAACISRVDEQGNLDYIHYEEGMLSRKKKSYHFPLRAIYKCLDHFQIKISDVDYVVLDFMNHKAVHNTAHYYRKLIGDYLRAGLAVREDQVRFAESHHLAHAYTAFYPSGFSDAAILVIDGLGSEQDTHSIYTACRESGIRKLYSQKGTGIGLLYSLITERLGFENGEEGKTMGLAPYGTEFSEMDKFIPNLEGSFSGFFTDYSRIMERQPSLRLKVDINKCASKQEVYSPYYARLAFLVQKELERCLLHLAAEIKVRTGCRRLCIAGGIGLNCVANEIIKDSGIFEDVFVQPASGDSGISLGLSLIGVDDIMSGSAGLNAKWKSDPSYFWIHSPVENDSTELVNLLTSYEVPCHKAEPEKIANSLVEKKVVAYFEGGWEFGPRALGHRSFLADPRPLEMKEILNRKIKHRELYRPFAPIMLEEHFSDYFESKSDKHPYMLFAVKCKDKTKQVAPTIVHVDGTARVQTCTSHYGRIYEVLKEFFKKTDVPILVNTSFNDNDEPIVLTPIDALSCFLRTGADVLVVDDILVYREEIPLPDELEMASRRIQTVAQAALYSQALEALITPGKRRESLKSFLARELLSSLYAKFNESCEILSQHLFVKPRIDMRKIIVTDEYHLDIINMLASYYKVDVSRRNILLVEDAAQSLALIPTNSFVVLFNLSIHLVDDEVLARFPHLASCESFYGVGDKKVTMAAGDAEFAEVDDIIMQSYEVDPSRSIDEFFAEHVAPEFNRLYRG